MQAFNQLYQQSVLTHCKRTFSGGECAKRIAGGETNNLTFPVAMRWGDTPVLIPNTMVKTLAADGTMLETAWESRWLPDSLGGIAQLGEHLPCKQGVKGSNPFISTEFQKEFSLYLENRILIKILKYQSLQKRDKQDIRGQILLRKIGRFCRIF